MEAERLAAEQERDRVFNLSLDLLEVANFDGYFTRLNPAFERVLGFTTAELTSQPFIEFVHPDDRASTATATQKLGAGEEVVGFENRYRCKDGSYRWILWSAMPDVEQNLIYAIGHDITERNEFYEFAIADDGPGIALEYQDRVFNIFQAVNPQNRTDSTGIGLAIVKKIIEAEGGTIRLESQIGKGTTFYFTWPKQIERG